MSLQTLAPIVLDKDLQQTIRVHEDGWRSNPAMRTLVNDYARAHVIVVVLGGVFVLGFAILSVRLWKNYRALRKAPLGPPKSTVTRQRMYFRAWLLSCAVTMSLGLVVFANASNAINPLPGFSMANTVKTPNSYAVDAALKDWIRSGEKPMPPLIKQKISKRISWQRPKAIATGFLFVLFAALSVKNWKALLRRTNAGKSLWQPQGLRLLAGKITVLPLAFLMLIMFLANTQGALAPVTISLLGGS
jgi:hypothetical protein